MRERFDRQRGLDLRALLRKVEENKNAHEWRTQYVKTSEKGEYGISIEDNLITPNVIKCKGCERILRCLAGKQITLTDAKILERYKETQCRCLCKKNLIRFYYWGVCYLSFDITQQVLVSHYPLRHAIVNIEINNTIKQYLYALHYNFPRIGLSEKRIKELLRAFKDSNADVCKVII